MALITSNVICYPETQNVNASSLARLQMMMQFIHSNYPESISLLDIAKVGEVSISTALNLFRNVLNTSPVNYLICYRLRKAALHSYQYRKKVTPRTKAAIKKLQEQGTLVAIASGRPTKGIAPVADELELRNTEVMFWLLTGPGS